MKANRVKSDAVVDEIEAVARALRRTIDNVAPGGVQARKDELGGPPPKPVSNPYAA